MNGAIHLLASSCLSFRVEQLSSHWTDLYEILYVRIFQESSYLSKI
jgi:hypothetical protein